MSRSNRGINNHRRSANRSAIEGSAVGEHEFSIEEVCFTKQLFSDDDGTRDSAIVHLANRVSAASQEEESISDVPLVSQAKAMTSFVNEIVIESMGPGFVPEVADNEVFELMQAHAREDRSGGLGFEQRAVGSTALSVMTYVSFQRTPNAGSLEDFQCVPNDYAVEASSPQTTQMAA